MWPSWAEKWGRWGFSAAERRRSQAQELARACSEVQPLSHHCLCKSGGACG